MPDASRHRAPTYTYRPSSDSLLGHYPVRFMMALAASLLVVVVCVRMPLYPASEAVGWHIVRSQEQITLEALEVEEEPLVKSGTPITQFGAPEPKQEAGEGGRVEEQEPETPAETPPSARERLETLPAVLEFAEIQPEIKGGLGAYYLNIEYPKAARDAGIQGRLVLDFIVETDGAPSNITLLSSLHPLCDSAAVRALRSTRFVPGRQNGELVRVKMRLPVRFVLLDTPKAPAAPASDTVPLGTH